MRRAYIALILILVMVLTAFLPALGTAEGDGQGFAYPLVEEKITLTFLVATTSYISSRYADMQVFKDYEELTNIHIDFIEIPIESWGEQVQLTLASQDLPDVIAGGIASIDSSLVAQYGKQGIIIPLEDLINEHTVNMKKYFNEYNTLRKVSTYSDGHIYAIPTLEENFNRTFIQLVINETWLEKLKMEAPRTLDDFRAYLRKVKTTDLNENGQLDEVGLSVISSDSCYLNYLMGSFGILDTGNHLYITKDDQVVFSPITDEYKAFLVYMNGMYEEGLIDPESFTQDQTQFMAKATSSTGVAASLQFLSISMGSNPICDYAITYPLTNNEGTTEWPKNNIINDLYLNSFCITSANKYPAETLKWLDYWMDNGTNGNTMRYGTQNEYWGYEEDGQHWQSYGTLPTGEPITDLQRSTVCPMAFVVPFWQFSDYFSMRIDEVDYVVEKRDTQAWYDPYLSRPYPIVYVEYDDLKTLSGIATELNNYINSQEALFITEGFTDKDWDAYVARCKALRCDEYLEIYARYYTDYLTK